MKKLFLIGLFCAMAAACAAAQDAHAFFAEDFLNQSVILVQGDKGGKQCHAVRIAPKWYLTAAHCVRPLCDKQCLVKVQLLSGPLQASALLEHNAAHPHVFVPRQYRPGNGKNIRYDLALLRFDPAAEDFSFYDGQRQTWLDEQGFLAALKKGPYAEQRTQWEALQKARPRLLSVTDGTSRRFVRPLAVPDLRPDGIYFHTSGERPFYFFTQLRHYLGQNFGVKRGMSGAGVIVPGGDVVGVVSAGLNGTLVLYDPNDTAVSTVQAPLDYFMFTPLNQQNVAFIRATVSSFRDGSAGPRFVPVMGRVAEQTGQTLQQAFPQLPAPQEIAASPEAK